MVGPNFRKEFCITFLCFLFGRSIAIEVIEIKSIPSIGSLADKRRASKNPKLQCWCDPCSGLSGSFWLVLSRRQIEDFVPWGLEINPLVWWLRALFVRGLVGLFGLSKEITIHVKGKTKKYNAWIQTNAALVGNQNKLRLVLSENHYEK